MPEEASRSAAIVESKPPPKQRKWLPTLGVLLVILVLVAGGQIAVGATEEPPRTIPLTSDVTYVTASGWVPVKGLNPGLRVSKGDGIFDATPLPFSGDAADLWRIVARVKTERSTLFRAAPELRIYSIAGVRAVQGEYIAAVRGLPFPIEGQVTTLVTRRGTGVVFDALAPYGRFASIADDITTMIASVRTT